MKYFYEVGSKLQNFEISVLNCFPVSDFSVRKKKKKKQERGLAKFYKDKLAD